MYRTIIFGVSKKINWLWSLPRKTHVFFFTVVPVFFVATFLYPISQSGLSGDDIPNSMISAALQANDWTRWKFINLAVKQWKTNEGRFFPVSTIENVYIFDFIHSVFLYKFLQLFVTMLLIILAAAFIAKLLGSWRILPLAIFVLVSCLQTRNWYDPTLGFGLLLQSVQIKILFFLYGVINFLQIEARRAYFYLSGSVLLWVMALLQYEVVVTLVPSLLVLLILHRGDYSRKRIVGGLFGAVTAMYLWFVYQLRTGITASSAYTVNTDASVFIHTYLKQLSGGVPFSATIWSRGAGSPFVALSNLPFLHLALLVTTIVLAVIYRSSLSNVTNRSALILLIIGLNFCFGPAITTAFSVRWQDEVAWGLSYLSVSFTYTGIAFISISVMVLALKAWGRRPAIERILVGLFTGFFALSAVSNHALLDSNANATEHAREQRALYETAIRQGFFSIVPDESVVVYPSYDENYWVNNYFTEWLGGPKDLVFVKTLDEARKKCDQDFFLSSCQTTFFLEYISTPEFSVGLSLGKFDALLRSPQSTRQFFG